MMEPADVEAQSVQQVGLRRRSSSLIKRFAASLAWLIWAVFWSFVSVDWQRVRHLFEVDILTETCNIGDCSLAKEQELLQTSAVFLFSAGLVSNFLSGSPWEVSTISTLASWVNNPQYVNHMQTLGVPSSATADHVIRHVTTSAAAFRGLWGTCMLLTLFAVICSYVSRTALFLCWSLIRMKLHNIRKGAKDRAMQEGYSFEDAKVIADVITRQEFTRATHTNPVNGSKPVKLLAPLERYIAFAVSGSKLFFIFSLLLWLVTIIYAIVSLHSLGSDPHSNHSRTAVGIVLLIIAVTITALAVTAFVRLLANCWTAYSLWKPAVSRAAFVERCETHGIRACFAEPKVRDWLVHLGIRISDYSLQKAGGLAVLQNTLPSPGIMMMTSPGAHPDDPPATESDIVADRDVSAGDYRSPFAISALPRTLQPRCDGTEVHRGQKKLPGQA